MNETGTGSDTCLSAQERLRELREQHVECEFATRDTERTPCQLEGAYVKHIPVLTVVCSNALIVRANQGKKT